METQNHLNLRGIEFTEFSSADPKSLHELFLAFGFSRIMRHKNKKIDLYQQRQITFLLNYEPQTFGHGFYEGHGPCVCSMGWKVDDAEYAQKTAVERGATKSENVDYQLNGQDLHAIKGIGESNIYLIDQFKSDSLYEDMGFERLDNPDIVEDLGFEFIDHLTNNVYQGTMKEVSDFYKNVFGFTEIKYFDIRGAKTGLTSYALQSPDKSFCIPINEGTEKKSQINEYLDEYKGPGVQHIALHTSNIIESISKLNKTNIETLDIDDQYYQEVFDRVPNVSEDPKKLQELQILVDGDEEGYLLQIFTRNIIGPIFFEIIQRKNHHAFGEGNFGALFRSIERDQEKRGYLK
ncbi:MAG: 4-hydroxyphenylpyruvate dioxygenase [Halobacteriovoraceae bacterium]|nr:4-hydroxyphenylpyruvate dioxygenase [Halobacteriovoraceae bacterium]|tara:strand:+ start:22728 stop:23774 length:1047 start_codon:yes stop_codon:yes gene_type:complete